MLLLNNLASVDPTLGEELYSRYFLIDIIASSTKDITIKRKRIPRTSLNPIADRERKGGLSLEIRGCYLKTIHFSNLKL